jgi:hypothetical protein
MTVAQNAPMAHNNDLDLTRKLRKMEQVSVMRKHENLLSGAVGVTFNLRSSRQRFGHDQVVNTNLTVVAMAAREQLDRSKLIFLFATMCIFIVPI